MNEHQYLLAWMVYVAAALGCLLACFRLTAWMWRYLREPLRVAVCVVLFSPTLTDATQGLLTPSIAIVALDWFGMGDSSAAALGSLKTGALVATILYLLLVLLRAFWQSLYPTKPAVALSAVPVAAALPDDAPPSGRARRREPYI